MTSPLYPLTKEHYLAFGVIVHSFARFERLIEISIHCAIGARSFGLAAMAISGLGYQAKSEALSALLGTVKFPNDDNAKILKYLTDFNSNLPLRNVIAHHVWREGKREGSIKPLKISVRGGKRRLQGTREEETDYTLDDLASIATSLNDQCEEFAAFLNSAGVFDSIDKQTARAKEA